jgi:type IV pilus assembly protein PilM
MALFGKKTLVGIDVGHATIKAVQLERSALGWKVTRAGTIATPPHSVKDGIVVEPDSVGQAIRDLLKDAGIHATAATVAVAGAQVVVRPVRMPKMPEATLRKSIKFEASRYVPSSVEDSYIEFEILGTVDEAQMDVMVVAAPKEVVQSRLNALEYAGLEVEAVDVEAFAAYRALIEANQDEDWSQSTIALVDIGSASTNMSVIQHGAFAMNRSITQGGHALTEALINYFKISEEDAEAGKAQLDLTELISEDQPKENPPLRVIQPHVDELVREVRRSLNYYQSQQSEGTQGRQVNKIILTGGGAKLPGLVAYFQHKLQVETIACGIYDNPRFLATAEDDHGLDLAVASGLAMRAFAKAA